MAKQKAAARKKTAPKKKAAKRATNGSGRRQTRREVEQVLRRGPVRRRVPTTAALPGMENIGDVPGLDVSCRRLHEIRDEMAELRASEAEEMQGALNLMRRANRTSYRQHGVELVRVPGEEKLRVRTSKAGATAETEEEAPSDVMPEDAVNEDAAF